MIAFPSAALVDYGWVGVGAVTGRWSSWGASAGVRLRVGSAAGAGGRPGTAARHRVRTWAHRKAAPLGRESGRSRPTRIPDAGRFRNCACDRQVVGPAGESDTGIGPYVESRAPSGVGNHVLDRPVLGDIGQRPATGLSPGAALGGNYRQVVGVLVRIVAEHNGGIHDQRFAVEAAGRDLEDVRSLLSAPTSRQVNAGLYFINNR